MAYEERKISTAKPHNINLDERKNLSINGVDRVESFDEQEVVMLTSAGNLIICGEGLHMGKLDLVAGEAVVTGKISELRYEDRGASEGRWKRIFR